jgi:hypothetical protein
LYKDLFYKSLFIYYTKIKRMSSEQYSDIRAVAKSLFAAFGGGKGGKGEDTSRSVKGRPPLATPLCILYSRLCNSPDLCITKKLLNEEEL